MFFVDDGISGTSFERSDFQRMQRMAEEGKICRIIVKDLSRFGREQVEAGRLTQIVYPSLGITFISIQENVNSTTGDGMEIIVLIAELNYTFVRRKVLNEIKNFGDAQITKAVEVSAKFTISEIWC